MHLVNSKTSPATISTYITALSYVNKMLSGNDPTSSFVIKKLLASVQRIAGKPDTRLPIDIQTLHKLIDGLHVTEPAVHDTIRMTAIFLTLYHALLRVGEITVRSSSNPSPVLNLSDCTFHYAKATPTAFTLSISHFKHNKSKKPFSIRVASARTYCPVKALEAYLRIRGNKAGPLFCTPSGKPMTRQCVDEALKRTLTFVGLDKRLYQCHSFRIGSASNLAIEGYSDDQIQRFGRWKSNAFKRYIRIPSLKI